MLSKFQGGRMEMVSKGEDRLVIKIFFNELIILHNSLNEVCNRLPTKNFLAANGLLSSELERLLKCCGKALKNIDEKQREIAQNEFY